MHTSQGAVVTWLRHNEKLSSSDHETDSEESDREVVSRPVVCNGLTAGSADFSLPHNGTDHHHWIGPANGDQPPLAIHYPGNANGGPLGKEWALLSKALVTNASTMGCCNKKKLLMVATSFCACASFAFLCIAVATDYWLYALERIKENNGSTTIRHTHTGLWRRCFTEGE